MTSRPAATPVRRRVTVVPLVLSLSLSLTMPVPAPAAVPPGAGEAPAWGALGSASRQATAGLARADAGARCGRPESLSETEGQACLVALRQAAGAGDPTAMVQLGWRYLVRDDAPFGPATVLVTPDNRVAEEWFRGAAALGQADAMASLGWMYREGYGAKQDSDEATRWLRLGAGAGSTRAMAMLGLQLLTRGGNAADEAVGEQWLRRAADAGDRRAMANLATLLMTRSGVPRRPPNWNMMSAAQQRDWLSASVRTPNDDPVGWLRRACVGTEEWIQPGVTTRDVPGSDSDAIACYHLGMLYTVGEMGVVRDTRAAVACFEAVERFAGDRVSRGWYELGNGRPPAVRQAAASAKADLRAAERRFAESAARARAQSDLGQLAGLAIILFLLAEAGGSSGAPFPGGTALDWGLFR